MYLLSFRSDQVEKHHPDGRREITFPDKSVKYISPNGEEMSIFTDGAVERLGTDGSRTIEFPNGQKEIHTKGHKVCCFAIPITQSVRDMIMTTLHAKGS